MRRSVSSLVFLSVLFLAAGGNEAWASRDAAFLAPGGASNRSGGQTEEAITVGPKAEVDVGETSLNIGRRATFFFVNQSNAPVEIESITANGDSNVRADIVADDCSNEKKIMVGSRCSVTVETMPTGSGSWTAELLMTHKAAGRIARARISGKTSSGVSQDKANMGLSLSTKDIKPVDFGEVEVGSGKAVRSALMVNDGNEVITLQSIEVIAAENGLQRLEQGCMMDMDLKMGESCPVTLIWKPDYRGALSTDLIIRHTGRLGFVVVPIRGVARDPKGEGDAAKGTGVAASSKSGGAAGNVPLPPTAEELEKMMSGGIPPLSADALPSSAMMQGGAPKAAPKTSGTYHLIGTVGNRALIYKPDGTTAIVAVGETIDEDEGKGVKITNVEPKKAEIFIDGKKKTLILEAVSSLTSRAAEERQRSGEPKGKKDSSKNGEPKETGSDRNVVPLPTGK